MLRVLCALALTVVAVHACCYTLQANPRLSNVPVYTWYLNTLSQQPIGPTDCVGLLKAVDHPGITLSQCQLGTVWSKPMDVAGADWLQVEDVIRHAIFTEPCIGFGPYAAGDRASGMLLRDSWWRLDMACSDSAFDSCVVFGLRLRNAVTSRIVVAEQLDTESGSCMRTASPTPSHTPTPSRTPSHKPTPSSTLEPIYGATYRLDATFDSGIFMSMQFGLRYEEIVSSSGASGSFFCPAPVFDSASSQTLITTLYPATGDARRGNSLSAAIHQHELAASLRQVTVVWSEGGWCRVTINMDNVVAFIGCRIYVGPDVHETVSWFHLEKLDPREVPQCGSTVTDPIARPTPPPVECSPDARDALVVMQSDIQYAEAIVAISTCSDASTRIVLKRVSALLTLTDYVEQACMINDAYTQAWCGDALLIAIAGTTCDSIEAPLMPITQRCIDVGEALLLLEHA